MSVPVSQSSQSPVQMVPFILQPIVPIAFRYVARTVSLSTCQITFRCTTGPKNDTNNGLKPLAGSR